MYESPSTQKGAPARAPLAISSRHQRPEVDPHGSGHQPVAEQTALNLDLPTPKRPSVPVEPTWWQNANTAIEELAESGVEFDAVDVAERIGEPASPRHWGHLFSAARRRGVITPTSAAPSRRRTVHGSLAYRWRGSAEVRQEAS